MKIMKKEYAVIEDGRVMQYILRNKNGMEVSFINYGAVITNILFPDKKGVVKDVALGYDDFAGYEKNAPGFGAFIGRAANRIAGAEVVIAGHTYKLEKNDGENCLHSGSRPYSRYLFDVEVFEEEEAASIEFSKLSPDMEQGFPGNLDVTVTYTLTESNELVIEYFAVSDKDTVVNFTNHSYFNLAGHDSGDILNHTLKLYADQYTVTDASLIPTGEFPAVFGTPMDFTKAKKVGADIEADFEPLKTAGGYDHNFVLKEYTGEVRKAAELYDEVSKRRLEVFTDLPGMQIYTANFLSGKEAGKAGCFYQKRAGICFESQYCPNSCNMDNIPNGYIRAGEEFESATIYKFSVCDI